MASPKPAVFGGRRSVFWMLLLGLLVAPLAMALPFARPAEPDRVFLAGSAADLPTLGVREFPVAEIFLARMKAGTLVAFSSRDPMDIPGFRACPLRWVAGYWSGLDLYIGNTPVEIGPGAFRSPCHGGLSTFLLTGQAIFGLRDLDRYPLAITPQGRVVVDTGTPIEGAQREPQTSTWFPAGSPRPPKFRGLPPP